ncbi:MAG: hypothetical protein QXH67_06250 [Candidatus Bathyarchaeia archaeon]
MSEETLSLFSKRLEEVEIEVRRLREWKEAAGKTFTEILARIKSLEEESEKTDISKTLARGFSDLVGVCVELSARLERLEAQRFKGGERVGEEKTDEPATENQKRWLKNHGVFIKPGLTKKEASKLIDQKIAEQGRKR